MKLTHQTEILIVGLGVIGGGYARALNEFDAWLGGFLSQLKEDDVLIITADHGCDPATPSTDHSREYVPLLICGKKIKPCDLNTLSGFSCIAKTVCDIFGAEIDCEGESFVKEIL